MKREAAPAEPRRKWDADAGLAKAVTFNNRSLRLQEPKHERKAEKVHTRCITRHHE